VPTELGPQRNPTFEGSLLLTRIRMLIAAALMLLVISASAPAAAQAGTRKQMIRTINYVRGWSHLRALRYSPRLSQGAAAWARSLMRRQVLAHSSSASGEILEWHTGPRAHIKRTVIEWWHSPGHRHVMLGHYRRAGAGRAVGYFGGLRCTIWVVRFAR
jgi:uncharacterized protein YkwD